jgi:hypothetical protein
MAITRALDDHLDAKLEARTDATADDRRMGWLAYVLRPLADRPETALRTVVLAMLDEIETSEREAGHRLAGHRATLYCFLKAFRQ